MAETNQRVLEVLMCPPTERLARWTEGVEVQLRSLRDLLHDVDVAIGREDTW